MNQAFTELADTPLGAIRSAILTDDVIIAKRASSLLTGKFEIRVQVFELDKQWLPDHARIDGSIGWRFFIKKISHGSVNLSLELAMESSDQELECFQDTSEGLAAVFIGSATHQMHLGTEDIEEHFRRAGTDDWMPVRLANELDPYRADPSMYAELLDQGIRINVPELYMGEKIYFHGLAAWHELRPSERYPGEEDISSWYAVDRSKKWLDEHLEIPE